MKTAQVVLITGAALGRRDFVTALSEESITLTFCCNYAILRIRNTQEYIVSGIEVRMSETTIHNRLPVLRAERGLSRQDLAKALGINYQTVGYLERGEYNPSLELAFRISEFFGLPIEAIFSRKPFKPLSEEVYTVQVRGGELRESLKRS